MTDFERMGFEEAAKEINLDFTLTELTYKYINGGFYVDELSWHQSGCCDCGLCMMSRVNYETGRAFPTLTIALGWDSFTGMRQNNVIHSVKIDMRADANTKFHITVDKDMQKMVLTPTPQAG